jgi:hypothetical protein
MPAANRVEQQGLWRNNTFGFLQNHRALCPLGSRVLRDPVKATLLKMLANLGNGFRTPALVSLEPIVPHRRTNCKGVGSPYQELLSKNAENLAPASFDRKNGKNELLKARTPSGKISIVLFMYIWHAPKCKL